MGKSHVFFPVLGNIANGIVHCVPFPSDVLVKLIEEAHAWIVSERQSRTDRIYEIQQAKRGPNSSVPRSKTEANAKR